MRQAAGPAINHFATAGQQLWPGGGATAPPRAPLAPPSMAQTTSVSARASSLRCGRWG